MNDEKMRLDKWLWVARFFKHRSLATEAVKGGKIHLNGTRVKPGRQVGPGDRLDISRNEFEAEIWITSVTPQRGPAKAAAELYRESEQSVAKRAQHQEASRLEASAAPYQKSRPNKKQRRQINQFRKGGLD